MFFSCSKHAIHFYCVWAFFFFLHCCVIISCSMLCLSIQALMDTICFQYLATTNSASMHISIHVSWWTYNAFLLGVYPGVALLGHRDGAGTSSVLVFIAKPFSKVVVPVHTPIRCGCSTSHPHLELQALILIQLDFAEKQVDQFSFSKVIGCLERHMCNVWWVWHLIQCSRSLDWGAQVESPTYFIAQI